MSRAIAGSLLLALLLPSRLAAQGFDLTVPGIMRGPELYGREPQQVRWSADGRWLLFRWNEPGTSWREPLRPYRVRAEAGARPERLDLATADSLAPLAEPGPLSPDGRRRVVSVRGDLYLVTLGTGELRRLTDTRNAETDPAWSGDGRRIFFTRDGGNALELTLADARIRQLTDIRPGPEPARDTARTAQRAALARDERALLGAVRDRLWQDSVARAEREARDARGPKPLWLQKDERVVELSVSPAGTAALVLTETRAAKARDTRIPVFVAADGYTADTAVRTKVGDEQATRRVGLMRLPSGETTWLDPLPQDSLPPSVLALRGWNDAGTHALLLAISRDNKTRVVSAVRADSARVVPLETLRDTAWIGGPCFTCAGWVEQGRRAWYVSEADGWAHLYTVAPDGADRRQLTRGDWEVLDVEPAPDGRAFWLHAREVSAHERHFYRLPAAGGALERLTEERGGHAVVVSPDGTRLADVFSTSSRPPELFVQPARRGAARARLTTSPTEEFLRGPWIEPTIVSIPASDGKAVPARLYRPQDLGAAPNGAAVIFVHGAGYLQNVHRFWSQYAREYMFHHLLASRGYVVLDLDYRASAGYGRDWRTAIYRHMGGRDLADHVDASRWLEREHGIAPERVGIYGGSYGGFITLMALFTAPRSFGAGAALRPVTDWAHYNHPYTSRILDFPQDDSVSYHRSSPIFHAAGLEDPLLIAHGMVDVNVHYQDVVRLAQRLIELGKPGWELASYPVEDHGFVRPDSWTDEYRRILELFERTIGKR